MSKSFGNFTDPNQLMDTYSADSYRFLLMSSTVMSGEDFALQDKDVGDVARKLSMIWNMYDFFTLYADVDGWEWNGGLDDPLRELSSPLDQWIVSRLHELQAQVTERMQAYDLPGALKPVLPFIDDASNWFVRRSRKRFWKAENGSDKADAYRTLHYVLVRLSQILAPFTPFLSEELYRKLTDRESVHLLDWPTAGEINAPLVAEMQQVRELITVGLAQRAEIGIKVRQPLASAVVRSSKTLSTEQFFGSILTEELNLKVVTFILDDQAAPMSVTLDSELTPELRQEGLMREVIRYVQQARKQAGLEVDDRIALSLTSPSDDMTALFANTSLTDIIKQETLTETLNDLQDGSYETSVTVEGSALLIALAKV